MNDQEINNEEMGRQYKLDQSRVIAFLDVDCFSVQVALKLYPELKGRPLATRRTPKDPINSVSYETTNVYKGMTKSEATNNCPNIKVLTLSKIPEFKAEEKKISDNLFDIIRKFCRKDITMEKMSKDDLFLDLTDKCNQFLKENFSYDKKFLEGLEVMIEGGVRKFSFAQNKDFHKTKWAEAVVLMTDLYDQIYHKIGIICSIGISFNKLLAKIGCKFNKPDTITIIASKSGIARVFKCCPISMCDGLGSKKGFEVQNRLKISTLHELRGFRRSHLINKFGTKAIGTVNGAFLWDVCRGIDNKPVELKLDFDTKGFKKTYGRGILSSNKILFEDLSKICEQMANEMNRDLKRNKRIAHRIRIEIFIKSGQTLSTTTFLMSRAYEAYDPKKIYDTVMAKDFPYINEKVRQYIHGFRIIAIDFKTAQTSDPISDITQQMSEITL